MSACICTALIKENKKLIKIQGEKNLKESIYKNYEELPLFLNADMVGKILGVSISTAYELMHKKGFPSVRIGSRFVVPKEKFEKWIDSKTEGQ